MKGARWPAAAGRHRRVAACASQGRGLGGVGGGEAMGGRDKGVERWLGGAGGEAGSRCQWRR
jgi:hypothetical protein